MKPTRFFITCILLLPLAAAAAELSGRKTVTLHSAQGESIVVAYIDFIPGDGGTGFVLAPEGKDFGDYFLAMRPFKCLSSAREQVCHFPQKTPGFIGENDFIDLEYALLFLYKKPSATSVDPWNGIYYELQRTPQGFEGVLKEADFNPFVLPRDEKSRPVGKPQLYPVDPKSHWLPRMTIN
ncbi:MAG: hypothetical protein ACREUV_11200 [Burkholderiales bacterium]